MCKPAVQEQAADSVSQKEVEAAPAAVPSRADQPLNDESRGKSLVVTAGTAWPVLSNTEDAGASTPGATGVDATEAEKANAVQVVDPTEVNELDRAAAAVPAEIRSSSFGSAPQASANALAHISATTSAGGSRRGFVQCLVDADIPR